MSTYRVAMTIIGQYTVEVDAKSEDEAIELAKAIPESEDNYCFEVENIDWVEEIVQTWCKSRLGCQFRKKLCTMN